MVQKPIWANEYGLDSGLDNGVAWASMLIGEASYKLRWIDGGTYIAGDPNSEVNSIRKVFLSKGFWIGESPVSREFWRSLMNVDPTGAFGDGNDPLCPVRNVSYLDCLRFIDLLNAKLGIDRISLPSEAQWEYAARSGTSSNYWWGGDMNLSYCNCDGFGVESDEVKGPGCTNPPNAYPPNQWGLLDMSGNVFEYCADWKGVNPPPSALNEYIEQGAYKGKSRSEIYVDLDRILTVTHTDPVGPQQGEERIKRGGGWRSMYDNCYSSYRSSTPEDEGSNDTGLRLVLN